MYDIPSNREKLNEMKALLEWYAAAGIDAAVADGPTNWLTDNAELNEDLLHALKSPRQPVKPPPIPAAPKPVSPQKTAPLSQPSIQEAVLSAEGATCSKNSKQR